MEANATIITHVEYDEMGNHKGYQFEWDGPEDGLLGISGQLLRLKLEIIEAPEKPQIADSIRFGPYQLEVVGIENDVWYCIRDKRL